MVVVVFCGSDWTADEYFAALCFIHSFFFFDERPVGFIHSSHHLRSHHSPGCGALTRNSTVLGGELGIGMKSVRAQ
jgi:hypothetical protein